MFTTGKLCIQNFGFCSEEEVIVVLGKIISSQRLEKLTGSAFALKILVASHVLRKTAGCPKENDEGGDEPPGMHLHLTPGTYLRHQKRSRPVSSEGFPLGS